MRKSAESVGDLLTEYVRKHELIIEESCRKLENHLTAVGEALVTSLKAGHKVLAFGNGGSATEASHFAGE